MKTKRGTVTELRTELGRKVSGPFPIKLLRTFRGLRFNLRGAMTLVLRPANLRTRLNIWYVGVLALLLLIYAIAVLAFQYLVLTRQLYHDEVQDVVTVEGLLYFDQAGNLQLTQNYYSRPRIHF
jgi:hypothetical protein